MYGTGILLESGTNELEIVEFYINEKDYRAHYGVNVAKVVEIIRMQKITVMPEMRHPAVLGAFPHRTGKIVPLINTAKYLGIESVPSDEDKIIVTEFNTIVTSFLVSGVNRIYRLSWSDVEAPGKMLQNMSKNSITGVVRLDERVVFILDLEAIVAEMHPTMAVSMEKVDSDITGNAKLQLHGKFNILHADDSGSIRTLVFNLLEKEGRFSVNQVVDGQEAWDFLLQIRKEVEKGVPLYNLIHGVITDIEMPRLDGMALCKKIKEDSILKDIPVIIFSSMITDSLVSKCASVGANGQFAKPDLKNLSNKMQSLIIKEWGLDNLKHIISV